MIWTLSQVGWFTAGPGNFGVVVQGKEEEHLRHSLQRTEQRLASQLASEESCRRELLEQASARAWKGVKIVFNIWDCFKIVGFAHMFKVSLVLILNDSELCYSQ